MAQPGETKSPLPAKAKYNVWRGSSAKGVQVVMCGPTRGLTLVSDGYNEHLAG